MGIVPTVPGFSIFAGMQGTRGCEQVSSMLMRFYALCLIMIAWTGSLWGCHRAKRETTDEYRNRYRKSEAACTRSPISPCRTVRSHRYVIEKGEWGFLDASIYSEERTEALDGDYSTSMTIISTTRKHWVFPVRRQNFTLLQLRPTDQIVVMDHIRRVIYRDMGARAHEVPGWNYGKDPDCSGANARYLYSEGRVPDSIIAGIPVVGYYWHREGETGKMYFAPSMGCKMFRRQVVQKNRVGFPTNISIEETDSFILGPPEAQLFEIPRDYKHETWKPGSTLDAP